MDLDDNFNAYVQGTVETFEDTSKSDSDKYQYVYTKYYGFSKIFDLGSASRGQLSL